MSDTATYPIANFVGACGEAISSPNTATAQGRMEPFMEASVNGSAPNVCVVGNDGAKVYGITLTKNAGIYDYIITVDAQGPSGVFSGSFYLAFTDQSGDTYHLSIYSSTRELHTVSYNSSQPSIVTIAWCDESFEKSYNPGNKTTKPRYATASGIVRSSA
jgi:hypothetical protein